MSTGTTRKAKTLLKGHALVGEGQNVSAEPNGPQCSSMCLWSYGNPNGAGHGRCSCGAVSPHLKNRAARKRWHAAHKDEMREAMT